MIKDLTLGFEKAKQLKDTILQDNYQLKEGIYIKLDLTKSWAEQSEEFEKNHLIIRAKEDDPPQADLLKWFKLRDYWSSLINMNKAVDGKKQIHSNNPNALFVKQDVFLGEKKDLKSTMPENVIRYFEATASEQVKLNWNSLIPSSKNNTDHLSIFQTSEYAKALNYLESANRLLGIEQIIAWYDKNLSELTEFVRGIPFKNYVKLFFSLESSTSSESLSCEQVYNFEYDLYTIPKIYNSNDYNQVINDELVGLPGFDMTMNSKKPYLEHKTMRVEAPDRVSLMQALSAKEATEWLASSELTPKYITNKLGYETGFTPPTMHAQAEGSFHVYMDGKYNELHGFENVPFPPKVSFDVEWINFLELKEKNEIKEYMPLRNPDNLQSTISSRFFRGRMNRSFIMDDPGVKSKDFTAIMAALFMQSKQGFHDWFNKGTIISIRGLFAKVTLRLVKEQLLYVENIRLADLADAFNLRLSVELFLNKEGGRRMGDRIQGLMAALRGKLISKEDAICSGDHEFYFTLGQLAYYLTEQSKAQNKKGDLYEPFLRARTGEQLKLQLKRTYSLYKHEVSTNHPKFRQAMSMVYGYELIDESNNDGQELLMAGLFANNLLFEKSAKGAEADGEDE